MKRNNVDAALIIEVSKPIAYGQYQFEKGDKLTYDVNSNLFIYRSESYSEDEDGTETTSIIAFGVDPDFVLDNADHFTCLIKKGILDTVEDDNKVENKQEVDTNENADASDKTLEKKFDINWLIEHADNLSNEELNDEVVEMMTTFRSALECYDLSLRKRFIGMGFDNQEDFEVERRINDTICNLSWVLRAFHDDKKRAAEGEKKKSLDDCCGEACTPAR